MKAGDSQSVQSSDGEQVGHVPYCISIKVLQELISYFCPRAFLSHGVNGPCCERSLFHWLLTHIHWCYRIRNIPSEVHEVSTTSIGSPTPKRSRWPLIFYVGERAAGFLTASSAVVYLASRSTSRPFFQHQQSSKTVSC